MRWIKTNKNHLVKEKKNRKKKIQIKKLGTIWMPVFHFNHWKMMFAIVKCKMIFFKFFNEKCRKTTKLR